MTYSQVADEVAKDCGCQHLSPDALEKNLRRRVYDSLNVLAALGVIVKDEKSVEWCGLEKLPWRSKSTFDAAPSSTSSLKSTHMSTTQIQDLRAELDGTSRRLTEKKTRLHKLRRRMASSSRMAARNISSVGGKPSESITCPFVI
eukprot:CAMPEP_0184687550 /NCGR_PEP_ID=MMETSP0312-20130426/26826_1 /TAXON_ID=31354 /ORGANISM="Compsopogon coeruleus, Strain SAG 36.94" /LENGTH=144 /DNA_ID=CAMNT_0027143823 /DNA_START=12 /DNA_END=443 /DNA_ORIENTATION=-